MHKILKIIKELIKPSIKEVQIFTYQFPNGKIYIGYTSRGLDYAHRCHQTFSSSPIYEYLHNEKTYKEPKYEETVYTDVYGDEIYKFLRKILDKYTTDTTQILNKNLYLLGYKNIKESYCINDKRVTPCVEPSGYQKDRRGRNVFFSSCGVCGIKKVRYL